MDIRLAVGLIAVNALLIWVVRIQHNDLAVAKRWIRDHQLHERIQPPKLYDHLAD